MMKTIGSMLGSFLIGCLVSFVLTLMMMKHHEAQQIVQQATHSVAQTAKSAAEAVTANTQIEKKLDVGKTQTAIAKVAIAKDAQLRKEIVYVPVQVPGQAEPQTCPVVDGNTAVPLTARSVRLLNDLRAARAVDLTSVNPFESQDTAGTTIAEFIDNDTDVVGMYNDLAIRHNELIDAITAFQAQQAKEAGVKK